MVGTLPIAHPLKVNVAFCYRIVSGNRGYGFAQLCACRPCRRLAAPLRGRYLPRPAAIVGPGRGLYLGNGLVLTAAHVIGSAARTKPSVCIAGGPACSTPDRSACSESSTWAP